jgi:L-cysteine S-thiosulfotransferase
MVRGKPMKQHLQRVIIVLVLALSAAACSKSEPVEKKKPFEELQPLKGTVKWTGEAIFIERCRDCHKVHETGGVVGPDLSTVGSRRDSIFIERVIRQPSQTYPGTVMPPYDTLPREQIKLLVDYLSGLK